MLRYQLVPGVQALPGNLVALPSGGRLALDRPLLAALQAVDGRTLPQALAYLAGTGLEPGLSAAVLACLCRAGLLQRGDDAAAAPAEAPTPAPPDSPGPSELLSVILVSYNSLAWLPACFASLEQQTYQPLEIIFIDNGSSDAGLEWVQQHAPGARCLHLPESVPFAAALNRGVGLAQGRYLLLLNPDVTLAPDALAQLVTVARAHPRCAAVAAKLRLMWADTFLNGLGNLVPALSWGTDSALGHLDLGQFDHWAELPSACFAAALIPRPALEVVGPFDEGFPMYYEDSEWSYRARLLGWQVWAAPQALIYHAFSSQVPSGAPTALAPIKQRRVVYGRLRWVMRLLAWPAALRFGANYALEDLGRALLALLRGRTPQVSAIAQGWGDIWRQRAALRQARRQLQTQRQVSDAALLGLQQHIPVPRIRHGLPQLTLDLIASDYAPWLAQGAYRSLPEWQAGAALPPPPAHAPSVWQRALGVWRDEGAAALLHRIARSWMWRLGRP